jgi:CRP/FNR family cyclic AMP-dependent transcriptional regulator
MVSTAAADHFQTAPWLADLDAPARLALLNVLQEGRAAAGAVLLAEGQLNDRITFLIEGTAQIIRSYPDRAEELVATLNAPTPFGETSFFRSKPSIVSVRARTPVWFLILDREAYTLFRRVDPHAAEQFALATVRVLAERFDLLDLRVSEFLAQHAHDQPRASEWAALRARLFEETSL